MRVKCRLNRELSAGRKEDIFLAVHMSHPAAFEDNHWICIKIISFCSKRICKGGNFFMKKLATLYRDSYRELKNVRTLTTAAMFGAVSVILGYFTIVAGPYLKIGFSSTANVLVYYLFGPVTGGCFGGMLDILKYIAKPTGAFFPGYTLIAILGGVIYGTILYQKPLTLKRVFMAKLAGILICNVILNTWCISITSGETMMYLLPARALKNLIQWPVDSFLFYGIAKKMESAGIMRTIRAYQAKNAGV